MTFGLVNVPVKLYSATEDHDVSLHQVHDEDGGRIHYERRCDVCERVIPFDHIEKAYVEDDETVVLTRDELDALPQERSKEIEVVEFVPSDQIDPILFDRTYYLAPAGKSTKAYVLLRRTLEKTDRTAIVQFALRQRTRLAALRIRDDVLTVQTLLWADEVREPSFSALEESVRISAKELELSAALVKSYSSDFAPEQYRDEYQQELRTLIDAKLDEGDALDTDATFGETDEDDGGEVIDLMEALRASVKKSRASRSGSGSSGSKATSGSKSGSDGQKSKSAAQGSKSMKSSKASKASKAAKSAKSTQSATSSKSAKSSGSGGTRSTRRAS
ncbi:hypothetical protein GCM10009847_08110 [Leucobacter tardus]